MSGHASTCGRLYIVATPIGHLEDITLRALRVLREVDRVAAEDTRVTAKLLNHHGIQAKLMRHDAHNTVESTAGLLSLLQAGEQIALVSDAGTPGLCDPGAHLSRAAAAAGVEVIPIPGPSAVTTFLSAAGLMEVGFTFHGFVQKKAGPRQRTWKALSSGAHVFFLPARDLSRWVGEIGDAVPDAEIVIARELTKQHETWYRGRAEALESALSVEDAGRGEAVLAIVVPARALQVSDSDIAARLRPLLKEGMRKKAAARIVAEDCGVPVRRAYTVSLQVEERDD